MAATFFTASRQSHYDIAKKLFLDYAKFIGIDLSFQHFEKELENIELDYNKPGGGIILCELNEECVGCAGIRKIDSETAELKRMFIKPGYHGKGLSGGLIDHSLEMARALGYKLVRLDTLPFMHRAIALYKKSGFYEIPAYYFNPNPGVIYMEKLL